jgi:tetratricopeptide (TPR) repeat protein/Ca2+-binding EF-hand superfamily protein
MRRVLLSFILIFLSFQALIFAQRDSIRTLFLDAESWFLFEEYAEALPLYQELHEKDPGNDNYNYKIGICLLHDPYQKDKAIQYLLDASENINPSYKENSVKERTAPPDALYHLGNAYLVNELLNHAIESYEEFLQIMDRDVYDEELVKAQIRSCKNAQRLKTMPVDIDLTLLDEIINTRYSDIRPVISGDGKKMAFVTELPFYDGAFFTEKTEEGWSYPQIITQSMGFDEDIYPVCLSYDGTEMILYYDDDYIGNLFYSRYEDGLWLPAVKMGENISTKYWESHACFSKDGQSLYFTSNRKGTHGGLDIYVSQRQSDGGWGPPENLGTDINSPYNEESPYISEDGQTLYFSSYGHYNMGGYDIFYSKKGMDGNWSEPVNIGYPINTTDNDLNFQPISNGDAAYYSVYSPRGVGQHDIYYMNIYSVNNPRLYYVTGNLRTEDGGMDSTQMAIYVIDTENDDTLVFTKPRQDGSFGFELKQGIYELHFSGEGYEELIRPLRITSESNKEGIQLRNDLELDLEEKAMVIFEGEESQIQLRDEHYEGPAGEVLTVPIRAPRGSTVVVRTYQDSMLVASDTIELVRRRTDLEIIPLPGSSEVEVALIDEDGNVHRNRFTVIGALPEIKDAEEDQVKSMSDPLMESAAGIILLEQAGTISGGDANVLKQELSENSDGALKDYVQQLDLEDEGIGTVEEFLNHLGEAAEPEGFTMDDLSRAMLESLGPDEEGENVEALISQLSLEAEGTLKEELEHLDPENEGITSPKELFEHLYEQAGPRGYPKNEVDAMLSDVLAHGDAELQRQLLIENSDGALEEYLLQLDLEAEGITNDGELLRHLEEVAGPKGFSMEDVRRAMLDSLDNPLEVDRVYGELLRTTDGEENEILKQLDLRKEGIYTVEELIEFLSRKLAEKGTGSREIEQILSDLFPDQKDLIQELGEKYGQDASSRGKPGWPLILLFIAVGAGLIWFIIVWWRRRDKEKEKDA